MFLHVRELAVTLECSENALTSSLFDIRTGAGLKLTSLTISATMGTGLSISSSLISLSADSTELTLSNCTFTGLTFDSVPLLAMSQWSLLTVALPCTFKDISRKSGNGAVFEATVGTNDSLTLPSSTFSSCSSLSGYGGAFYITITGEGSLVLGESVDDPLQLKGMEAHS